jgi:hypothetical protein
MKHRDLSEEEFDQWQIHKTTLDKYYLEEEIY